MAKYCLFERHHLRQPVLRRIGKRGAEGTGKGYAPVLRHILLKGRALREPWSGRALCRKKSSSKDPLGIACI